MSDPGLPAINDPDLSVENELIVVNEQLGFVSDLLQHQVDTVVSNRRLGLSKLTLRGDSAVIAVNEAVTAQPGASDIKAAMLLRAAATPTMRIRPNRADAQLTEVIAGLRAVAAAAHAGWMPTIGKNRLVARDRTSAGVDAANREISVGAPPTGRVGAAREISVGGAGAPASVADIKGWVAPRPRRAKAGQGVRVGLLDTKIWAHPWLAGGWVARPGDILSDARRRDFVAGHATFVTGLILQHAPGATVEVRSVLDDNGEGKAWDVAEAIVELGHSGVSVLNLSLACYTADGQAPLVLARAVQEVHHDVVLVASAGNHAAEPEGIDGPGRTTQGAKAEPRPRFADLPSWPAALDDVLAVGALDEYGERAVFSPDRPWVDVEAEGVRLTSTYLPRAGAPGIKPIEFQDWASWTGTSFAAAVVSGRIAAGTVPGRRPPQDALRALVRAGVVKPRK